MKHAPGQWTITVDHLAEPGAKPGTNANAVGLFGPRNASMNAEEIIANTDSKAFCLWDDDKQICYEGKCFLPDGLTEDAFGPLDDFGEPNAGATSIEYKNESGVWEPL